MGRADDSSRRDPMNDAILLQTSGRGFTTRSGRAIVLRGVGLGGWKNGDTSPAVHPPRKPPAREGFRPPRGGPFSRPFFARSLDVFFADVDAAFIPSLGLNSVRLAVNYRHFEDDMRPFE